MFLIVSQVPTQRPQPALTPFATFHGISLIFFFAFEWTLSLHVGTLCVNQSIMKHKPHVVRLKQGCHLGLT